MSGWLVVVVVALAVTGWAAAAAIAIAAANATIVYVVHGNSWATPLRVGVTDADDWAGYRHCRRCDCRRHRLCAYSAGRDRSSRSELWAHEVDWRARPKRWPALRRRHRVLYVPVPWRPLALRLERRLIRRYCPPWNTQHVPGEVLAARRRSRV